MRDFVSTSKNHYNNMKTGKFIHTILLALSAIFTSCEYDYDMPDMSGVKYRYNISELSDEMSDKLIDEVESTGRPMERLGSALTPIIIEKDAAGKILYQGEPRGIVNDETKTLEVAYKCEAPLPPELTINQPRLRYDMGYFKFNKSFPVEISPKGMIIRITNDDKFTADLTMGCRIYSIENQLIKTMMDDAESIGYEVKNLEYTIEELNSNGETANIVKSSSISSLHFASADSVVSAKISATVIATPKSTYDYPSIPIFTYVFTKPFPLDAFHITDIKLSSSQAYTKENDTSVMGSIYTVRNNIMKQMSDDINATGHEYEGIEYVMTEKDQDGKVLRIVQKTSNDELNDAIISEVGAASVEITAKAYGITSEEHAPTWIYEYTFNPVKLDPLQPTSIELSEALGYTRTPNASLPTVYTLDNEMKSKIAEDLEAAGHDWFGIDFVDYDITEKDAMGNMLRTTHIKDSEIAYGDGLTSVPRATSVEITINAYGRQGAYDKVLVYRYKFPAFALTPLQTNAIILSETMDYIREDIMPTS